MSEAAAGSGATADFVALCERLQGFGFEREVDAVDGYLAALVAGPRVVLPSQWLPALFGDTLERACADPEAWSSACATLMARWNELAAMLEPRRLAEDDGRLWLEPLIHVVDGERLGAVWAVGFLDAVQDPACGWLDTPLDSRDAAWLDDALAALRDLLRPDDDAGLRRRWARRHGTRPLQRDALVDEAVAAVQDLRLLWHERALRPAPIVKGPQAGRNDPCPCGSGRKFKRCHGAG